MSNDPVLVIQPRRLGDLILTFPLLLRLQSLYPGHPLWVMAQKGFYEPLLPFSPKAAYFPPERLPQMAAQKYEAIINLGGSREAALFCGQSDANLKLGHIESAGRLAINGFWQLYREGLVQNNRHNLFHWADLYRLDLPGAIPPHSPPKMAGSGRVGLFVGASEISKRPNAGFWAELANRLAASGLKPVLFGGPGDVAMGMAIMAKGARAANFCGKTKLAQLAGLLKTVDLLIAPDTGPMHLADWLSVPVLNLSMGNVNAAETGPLSPGQLILRAAMSCSGCWQCQRQKTFCKDAFLPPMVANLALNLISGAPMPALPGLELLKSGAGASGLRELIGRPVSARSRLEDFWQAAFIYFNDASQLNGLREAAAALNSEYGQIAAQMRATFGKMLAIMAKSGKGGEPLPDSFWQAQPLHSRLFAGQLHIFLQNSAFSRAAFGQALARIDSLQALLAHSA